MESKKNLVDDFFREQKEKEHILSLPINGFTMLQLANVRKSELSKRIDEKYKDISLSDFLKKTGIK